MLVPDEVRKSVGFLVCRLQHDFALAGTVFFAGIEHPELERGRAFAYAVTAKHVIEKIKKKSIDRQAYLRLNFCDASAQLIGTELSDWHFHPDDAALDVAVLPMSFPTNVDHLAYPTSSFATADVIEKEKIGIGEEVFLVGLFTEHHGKKRNIPIIRVGNIAAMPEEAVETRLGPTDAYLVEARSIGGLSGSPVFVHLGVVRPRGEGQPPRFATYPTGIYYLLGLMHGHWYTEDEQTDSILLDESIREKINMGIAIVVPATKILEVIRQPVLSERMERQLSEMRKARLPQMD